RDGAEPDAAIRCPARPPPCPAGMEYVPCGPFLMGSDPGEGESPDEEPEHVVFVSAFCIDRTEVTNGDYAGCVAERRCEPPRSRGSATRTEYFGVPEYAEFPVLHVDWGQASAFCEWRGKALPTEAEWEKAARGGCEIAEPETCGPEDERPFPWGDAWPTCESANHAVAGCTGDADRVGARPTGAGPYGTSDMTGNVSEWTRDRYSAGAYAACAPSCADPSGPASGTTRVIRGGSWNYVASNLRLTNRSDQDPGFSGAQVGFRCAAPMR
ncbi:MAG: SUMF1/EgtB/PvdO family nonheme iron enzyme, partial [Myxococcota bacterium]|nr:SUMF1/EgtB/PvdO family nonheme iron enzyme [Myxococcota bacterium]